MEPVDIFMEGFKATNRALVTQLQTDLTKRVAEFEDKDEQDASVQQIASTMFLESAKWAGSRGAEVAFEKCENDQTRFDKEFLEVWKRWLTVLLGRHYTPEHPAYQRLLEKQKQTKQQSEQQGNK